jgi:hypothetical protein
MFKCLKKFLIIKVFFCFYFFLGFSIFKKYICSVFFFFVTTFFQFIQLFFFNLKFLQHLVESLDRVTTLRLYSTVFSAPSE